MEAYARVPNASSRQASFAAETENRIQLKSGDVTIGISKETYRSLFGTQISQPSPSDAGEATGSGYDFTALDRLMPHPVYGPMYWVCVLNPSTETFQEVVAPLLGEAYDRDVSRHARRAARE